MEVGAAAEAEAKANLSLVEEVVPVPHKGQSSRSSNLQSLYKRCHTSSPQRLNLPVKSCNCSER